MPQLALFPEATAGCENVTHSAFSHGGVCPDKERQALEARHTHLFEETDRFNRKLVSFQANKTEALHGWMKYLIHDVSGLQADPLPSRQELIAGNALFVLPQRKGNSSQQMGRFGRQALRKSITIWQKP
jgi:hypothetical protein